MGSPIGATFRTRISAPRVTPMSINRLFTGPSPHTRTITTLSPGLHSFKDISISIPLSSYTRTNNCCAIPLLRASLESFTFTIRFPPFSEMTVIKAPGTIPNPSRNFLVDSLALQTLIMADSPRGNIVKGIPQSPLLFNYFVFQFIRVILLTILTPFLPVRLITSININVLNILIFSKVCL